jgi:hypothetical protein
MGMSLPAMLLLVLFDVPKIANMQCVSWAQIKDCFHAWTFMSQLRDHAANHHHTHKRRMHVSTEC